MKRTTENRISTWMLLAGLVVVVAVVAAMCIFYISRLSRTMEEETHVYLSEISQHISTTVDTEVENIVLNLESITETCVELNDDDEVMGLLENKARRFGFTRLILASRDGKGYASDGTFADLSGQPYFTAALSGGNVVYGRAASPVDSVGTMLYAVPVRVDGIVQGVLIAENSKDSLRSFLSMSIFGGKGYSQIVARDGDFIITADNENTPKGADNIFTLLGARGWMDTGYTVAAMRADMSEGRSGRLYYMLEGVHKVMDYRPLNTGGWYLLSVVPTKVTSERTAPFIAMSVYINVTILLLLMALIAAILLQHRKYRHRLERMAFVDPVTNGRNHVKFEIDARKLLQGALPGAYAMVSMDIEKFKLINISYGSEKGNHTLRHVYNMLNSNIGRDEAVARITADKFCLLLKNSPPDALVGRLHQMVENVNQFNAERIQKFFLHMPAGIYIIDDPGLGLVALLDRANSARKNNHARPQKSRLNPCIFYSDVERLRMVREREIDNRMESALENGRFVVYLQPKYNLCDSTLAGAEALVRWDDPERGLIPPNDFIPVFEKNGFIVQVDLYVFEEVCRLLRRWLDAGRQPVPISVNLSRVHLDNPDFLDKYEAVYRKYGFPANLIELELTETLVFENVEELLSLIERIHGIGFTCSLDDFGSGYSSMNLLKDIPVDTLKLDRAFLSYRKDNERGNYVVETVVSLANKLNMHTVSEGVETIPQVEFLKSVHCDMAQGFIFCRPVPICQFEELAFHSPPLTCPSEKINAIANA